MGKNTYRKKSKTRNKSKTRRIKRGGQKQTQKQVRLLFSKKKTGPGTNVMIRVFAKPSESNILGFDVLSKLVDNYTQQINELISIIKAGDKAYPKKEDVVDIFVGDGNADGSSNPPFRKQVRMLFSKKETGPGINATIRIFAKPPAPTSTIDIAGISTLMNYYMQNIEEQFALFKEGDNEFPKREKVIDIFIHNSSEKPVDISKTDK